MFSYIGHQEPSRSVTKLVVDFLQSARLNASRVDDSGQLVCKIRIVKLHSQLAIEAKAWHVPIRAANEAPVAESA